MEGQVEQAVLVRYPSACILLQTRFTIRGNINLTGLLPVDPHSGLHDHFIRVIGLELWRFR